MNYFTKTLPALIVLTSAFTVQAQQPDLKKNEAQIQAVVESFRTAIIEKDKPRFLALFHGMAIPWIAVYEDSTLTKLQRRYPGMPKADPIETPGPEKFIDFVVQEPIPIEEKFSSVRITNDGMIASVFFDYSFHKGDYKSHWGTEGWHLVNTDHGWKINSVIYSIENNPVPPTRTKK